MLTCRQFFTNRFIWKLLATIGLIDGIWLHLAGMQVESGPASAFFIVLFSACLLASYVCLCYRNDHLYLLFQCGAQLILGSALVTGLSYLSARLDFPLCDEWLIAADRHLFFNWLNWLSWLNDHPRLAHVLSWAYVSSDLQFAAVVLCLLAYKKMEHLQNFIITFFLSGLVVISLGAMFPAVAGYMYYNIDLTQLPNLHPTAPRDQEVMLLGMREHSIAILPLKFDGIVQFPSFHSVLAVLFVYASMPIRWLRRIAIPLNVLMVLSTPVDGGHYLMDILFGIAIAFGIIGVTERLFQPVADMPEMLPARS